MKHIEIINGEIFEDHRGAIISNNGFDLTDIKRIYTIHHPNKEIIRAWQGHLHEVKYFKCIKGSFVVAWKEIEQDLMNINNENAEYHILDSKNNEVLKIPNGYANGLKAIENDSSILVFSDFNLNDSIKEKIRYDSNQWLDWSQF